MKTWFRNVVISLDVFLNAVTGGKKTETMSRRAAMAAAKGKRWGCIMCKLLDAIVERDHCAKTLADGDEETDGFAAVRAAVALFALAWLIDMSARSLLRLMF